MTQELWSTVDDYLTTTLSPDDAALEAARRRSDDAGLPPIAVAPNQGKLLYLLAKLAGARRILEVGTLGGYSTIWLARALPSDGELITLEFDAKHAEVARENLAAAGLGDRVDIRLGLAAETLPTLDGTFEFVFIDADKVNNPTYFTEALRLTKPGSVIVVDNVVRGGAVADAASTDPAILGIRRMNELIANEPRVDATSLQTVGGKGYDGLTIALVVA
ncbi:O-methyltransferase [Amycolatopsis sp. NPDC059657]|uniref:O-methyltransferase n=1 Tax=Amycolatopsis sp. NPDC059657 TaxID=3346899 RepID=UPI00366FA3AA